MKANLAGNPSWGWSPYAHKRALKHWQVSPMALDSIQILRVNGGNGAFMVFACLPRKDVGGLGAASLGSPIDPSDLPSVFCDCSSVVHLRDPDTMRAMSAWIMSAATWLQEQQARDTEVDR